MHVHVDALIRESACPLERRPSYRSQIHRRLSLLRLPANLCVASSMESTMSFTLDFPLTSKHSTVVVSPMLDSEGDAQLMPE